MQLHPTRTAVDLTGVAIFIIAIGVLSEKAAILAWGGALLVGLMVARSVTLLGVARVRSAGFEMLWQQPERSATIGRGHCIELEAEVRNRDDRAARYVHLRSLHSPHLDVELEPTSGEVPAGGRLSVSVKVTGKRVGRHGLFGLSLEVQGSPGLYEVPLTFANPFGVHVLPAIYSTRTRPAIGGRSRSRAESGRPGTRPLGNYDLREIREYQFGDPFKRIAWKASARRGQLLVREFDLEEREVIWLVLDASVELWAGPDGKAPLDTAIETVAMLAESQLEHGNRVGLAIVAARKLAWLPPGAGAAHAAQVMQALSIATGCYDADRSDLDDADLGLRVIEHMRPLDPALAGNVHKSELDRIARRASQMTRRYVFAGGPPFSNSPRDAVMRRYLAGFGVDSPPRLEPDRPKTDACLLETLKEITRERPRASRVIVFSPSPDPMQQGHLLEGLAKLPKRSTRIQWLATALDAGLDTDELNITKEVRYATKLRTLAVSESGAHALRRAGLSLLRPPSRHSRRRMSPPTSEAPAAGAETEASGASLSKPTDKESAA